MKFKIFVERLHKNRVANNAFKQLNLHLNNNLIFKILISNCGLKN